MPFQPGQSGNPNGRPKLNLELQALARAQTAECLEVLQAIARDIKAPPAARVSAANSLLDRGWGKPAQSLDLTHDVTDRLAEVMNIVNGTARGLPKSG